MSNNESSDVKIARIEEKLDSLIVLNHQHIIDDEKVHIAQQNKIDEFDDFRKKILYGVAGIGLILTAAWGIIKIIASFASGH